MTSSTSISITPTGPTAPTYAEIQSYLIDKAQSIYGSDIYLESDSPLYQLISVVAEVANDSNSSGINVINSYSPSNAQGTQQSSLVKINGINRLVSTNSTAVVVVVGQAGTIINNGIVADAVGNQYALPPVLIIPLTGSATVLATSTVPGAISSPAGSITNIVTNTLGWQSVTNPAASIPGSPVETDAQLRKRQAISTSYPALTVNQAILAAVANVNSVSQSVLYENSASTTDSNGLPGHSISVVTQGGDPVAIAQAIANRKTPGTTTYGNTSETVNVGNTSIVINFSVAVPEVIHAVISLHPLPGYTTDIGNTVEQNLVDFIANAEIGQNVYLTQAYAALVGPQYNIVSIAFGIGSTTPTIADVVIPYNGLATLLLSNVTLTLV